MVQRSALCRSRRELSNECLLAKIGVDTTESKIVYWYSSRFETGPPKACQKIPKARRKARASTGEDDRRQGGRLGHRGPGPSQARQGRRLRAASEARQDFIAEGGEPP